jgi:formate hydrogenlyase subunit 6/NADH:ubiquinone oxidoreductase subunit I
MAWQAQRFLLTDVASGLWLTIKYLFRPKITVNTL